MVKLRHPGRTGTGHRKSRGQSLVEFAIILPVFLLLFAAILDLGRIAAAQISVTNAAREGAFQAAQTPTSFQAGAPCDTTTNLVVCRVQLEAEGSGVTIAPTDIALTCTPDCSHALNRNVTVSVTGHFQLLTTILSGFFGGNQTIAFTARTTNQIEVLPAPSSTAAPSPSPSPSPPPSPSPGVSPSPSPSPTPTPACLPPSAGFTHSESPPSMHAPVTLTVVDTSTPTGVCITNWTWNWGDGYISYGKVPGTHTYWVAGDYSVTLTVDGPGGTNTSGAVIIKVKP